MIRDSEFGDDKIKQFIENNNVGRNAFLNNFIKSLNTIDKSIYLSIDADWGSGKTVFMKQIKWLNENDDLDFNPIEDLDSKTIQQFREKYEVFYYNAWQNDNHEDPLQSLIFNLLAELKNKNKGKYWKEIIKGNVSRNKGVIFNLAMTATVSHIPYIQDIPRTDFFKKIIFAITEFILFIFKFIPFLKDIKLDKNTKFDSFIDSIKNTEKRKEALSELIEKILKKEKKFLFIIDELDRCNPKFAVNLLEAIKHYCDDDNIVFILSTNNQQLAHTVKKYYGNDFDGYGYLNRMYDLTFSLPEINPHTYLTKNLGVGNKGHGMPCRIADHLKLTMREINRYYSLLSLIKKSTWNISTEDTLLKNTSWLFIPLAIALKVHDLDKYKDFVSPNKGAYIFDDISKSTDILSLINPSWDKLESLKETKDVYNKVINYNKYKQNVIYKEDDPIIKAGILFQESIQLIGKSTEIDNLKK